MGAIWGGHATGNGGDVPPYSPATPLESVFLPPQGVTLGHWFPHPILWDVPAEFFRAPETHGPAPVQAHRGQR